MMMRKSLLAGAMAAAIFLPKVSFADKLILSNGTEREGLVSDDPAKPENIIFQDHRGSLRLPRTAVKQIVKEEPWKGYLAIAAGYLEAGNTIEAANYFEKADEAGAPQDEIKKGKIKAQQTEQKLHREGHATKMTEAEELMAKAEKQAQSQDFEGADQSYEKARGLNPTDEQKASITAGLIAANLAWGRQCVDHLQNEAAAKHLAKVRDLDPGNQEALRELIKCWKKDPNRKGEIADYYEKELARYPSDLKLRLEVADARFDLGDYPRAFPHYLAIFQAGKAVVYGVTGRLDKCFQVLQQEAADKSDFAVALRINQQYRACFPNSDASTGLNYEYAVRRQQIVASTSSSTGTARLEQLTTLASWCRAQGLDGQARKEIAYVLRLRPNYPSALKMMTEYARPSLQRAQAQFDAQDFAAAVNIAQQTIQDYSEDPQVVDQAAGLIEKCKTEIQKRQEDAIRERQRQQENPPQPQINIVVSNVNDIRSTNQNTNVNNIRSTNQNTNVNNIRNRNENVDIHPRPRPWPIIVGPVTPPPHPPIPPTPTSGRFMPPIPYPKPRPIATQAPGPVIPAPNPPSRPIPAPTPPPQARVN